MRTIRKACLSGKVTPVLCGSAFKNKGVQRLLDAVLSYLPSPLDRGTVHGVHPATKTPQERRVDPESPLAALAFKIMSDPHVGKLTYVRVYSGTLSAGSYVFNSSTGKRERVTRLLQMSANKRQEIKECVSGNIAAVVGLKDTRTGHTLCDESKQIELESMKFAEPVISVAIEPKTKADQDKLSQSLNRLSEEDPTFRMTTDEETGQTLIAGMGELHLEIIVDRLLREFKVQANVGRPQVAYRETIRKSVTAEGKFIRQSGGRGQYGHVKVTVEPGDPGKELEFVNGIVGGAIPNEYIRPVEQGVLEAMRNGVMAGYPLTGLKVTLIDGSYHDVDSSEIAFKIAGSMALREGASKAHPVLLEPMMDVEVGVPEVYRGEVIGDLTSRRGKVEGIVPRRDAQVVAAQVPLSEMFGYATTLRSLTQGRAVYTMQFSRYHEVPVKVSQDILERVNGA